MTTEGAEERRPEILIVSQFFHPERVGSAFYATDLARALSDSGWTVSVLTGEPYYPTFEKDPRYRSYIRRETVHGVHVHRLRTFVPRRGALVWRLVSEANFLIRGMFAIASGRVRRASMVLAIAPGPSAVLLARLFRKRRGRLVALVHDVSSRLAATTGLVRARGARRLLEWIEAFTLGRADVLAVLSSHMSKELRTIGVRGSIEVVPIWVAAPLVGAQPTPAIEPVVMYSGAFARKYGLDRLLALAASLGRSTPEARLIIQGSGPLEQHLRNRAAEMALTNVEFRPLVDEAELPAALAEARVHVLPQDSASAELSIPSKVFSALAVGRPIVASARRGSPFHDLSRLCSAVTCVDPDDAQAMHDAVAARVTDRDLAEKEGADGYQYVTEHHDRDKIIGRLVGLLTS